MAQPVKFDGYNVLLRRPTGMDELSCSDMHVFNNGVTSVSCWELTEADIEEIVRTKKVYVSVWFGKTQPPIFIGNEDDTRDLIADNGVWSKSS